MGRVAYACGVAFAEVEQRHTCPGLAWLAQASHFDLAARWFVYFFGNLRFVAWILRTGSLTIRAAFPSFRLVFLACGPEQDFVHVHIIRLADGEGDHSRERVSGDRCFRIELVNSFGGFGVGHAVR
jgi:hypothetical protein